MDKQTENEINMVIEELYANNGSKLRQMCNKRIAKLGGISQQEYDDFYSRVGYEIAKAKTAYDPSKGKTFMGYLCGVIKFAIWKEKTDKNRGKRQNFIEYEETDENGNVIKNKEYISDVSLDAPIGDGDGLTIADTLQSDFNMEDNLEDGNENVENFLKNLPNLQRQIIKLKMEDISVSEIKSKLGLSDKEYSEQMNQIKSFDNIKTINQLFANSNKYSEQEEEITMMTTQTAEKSKPMQYSIASINKKIENRTIRFDHPLQRESDQWNPSMKGNLISDILQGNPLPEIVFAEQIVNGIPVIWDLDGKQRCTNCYSFANDGFKISRNIRRWNIQYLSQIKDGNGKPILDENGFPTSEYKEFDIRNKKFSQLPIELQEKFLDYTFKCDQYLNCDSEEIAYHIIRYNEGKAMSKSQKGITRIGEEFAALVKSISAMPFFRERGGYKVSEAKNGTLERVVVESVMASKYLSEWKKEQESICEYLKDNASSEDFDNFEVMVERLEKVVTEDISDMFNSKDSFLWFGLFARFVNTGEDDKRFVEFMAEFAQSLHSKEVNGTTFDKLCIDPKTGNTRSTKDKYIVVPKMELLEKLMMEYLGVNKEDTEEIDCIKFVKDNLGDDVTNEDVELFEIVANDKAELVNEDSWILSYKSRPSFVAIVGHAIREDNEEMLEEWLPVYERNNKFILNQKDAFLHMKSDFNKFLEKGKAA